MARGIVFRWRGDIGDQGFSPVPPGIDYDLWTGPAPKRPFTRNLVHYNWHGHWDYGNGDVGNQGIHETDLCMWGLDVGLPTKITSMGGKFLWDDCKEVPEVLTSVYNYPEERKIIQFEVRPWCTNTEEGATVGRIGPRANLARMGESREPEWTVEPVERTDILPILSRQCASAIKLS